MTTTKFLIAVFCLVFAGLSGATEAEFNVHEWFAKNKVELVSMKHVLEEHPKIERVDPELRMMFVSGSDEFSDLDTAAYQELLKKCELLSIKNIAIYRKEIEEEQQISSAEFVVLSAGLLTKGRSISIEYLKDESFVEKASSYGLRYQPLGKKGWFAVYRVQK